MKEIYDLFIDLSLQQCTKDDYLDKSKVNMHNIASKKLRNLQDEMVNGEHTETIKMLLTHQDERVQINAATVCLRKQIFVYEATEILKKISTFSNDSTLRFSAQNILQSFS